MFKKIKWLAPLLLLASGSSYGAPKAPLFNPAAVWMYDAGGNPIASSAGALNINFGIGSLVSSVPANEGPILAPTAIWVFDGFGNPIASTSGSLNVNCVSGCSGGGGGGGGVNGVFATYPLQVTPGPSPSPTVGFVNFASGQVLAGPSSGPSAAPSPRALVFSDLPQLTSTEINYTPAVPTNWPSPAPSNTQQGLDDLSASQILIPQAAISFLAGPTFGTGSGVPTFRAIRADDIPFSFVDSLTISGPNVSLVNDSTSPGNNTFYGTSGAGVKGWYFQQFAVDGNSNALAVSGSGGSLAGGFQNVFIGADAGSTVTTGANNVALGTLTVNGNTFNRQVAIGSTASTGAAQATALGYATSASGTSSVALGSGAHATAAGAVAIGLNATAGQVNTITMGEVIQLVVQGSGVTPTCASGNNGTVAITNAYVMCVCNGGATSWVHVSDGTTACTF